MKKVKIPQETLEKLHEHIEDGEKSLNDRVVKSKLVGYTGPTHRHDFENGGCIYLVPTHSTGFADVESDDLPDKVEIIDEDEVPKTIIEMATITIAMKEKDMENLPQYDLSNLVSFDE